MNGRELILSALRHEKLDRVPWVPYTGVHIGSLKNYPADKLLTDGELLLDALLFANELYSPDGLTLLFDLQVEAEILGCGLKWDRTAPPSVISHPLADTMDISLSPPQKDSGRIPMILKTLEELKSRIGGEAALFGLICGPLTLGSHLRGTRFFLDFKRNPSFVHEVVAFATEVNIQMAKYYIDEGIDVLAVVDPIISQISPVHFETFFSEPYTRIFESIRNQNTPSSFFVCGDATKNIEVMCKTSPDAVAIDENIDIVKAKEITDRYNITIMGNIPLISVMYLGNQQDNQKSAIDLIDKLGNNNFILAPGCDIPYAVPRENIIGIGQAVQNIEETREFLKNYVKEDIDLKVDMPDYNHLDRPLVEVFTIDSLTCAACTYMKASAFEMKDVFGEKVEIVERKSAELENIVRMNKLDIRNLPAIVINGELKYSSIIPDRESLKNELKGLI